MEEQRRHKRARSNSKRAMSFPRSLSRKHSSQAEPAIDGVVVRGSTIKDGPLLDGASGESFDNPGDHPRAERLPPNRPKLELRTIEDGKLDHTSKESHTEDGHQSPVQNGEHLKSPMQGVRNRITFASPASPLRERPHKRIFTFQGVGARHDLQNDPVRTEPRPDSIPPTPMGENRFSGKAHQFAYPGFIGRNSQFSSLTVVEREQLGGVEYRAIEVLAIIVPLYFFLWQFLGALGLGAYIAHNHKNVTEANGLNPWFVTVCHHFNYQLIVTAGGSERSMPSPHSTIQGCPCWMPTWSEFTRHRTGPTAE